MNEQVRSVKRTDPIGLVIFFAVVAVLLGATYMLAENIATEGEAVRARIDAIGRQSTAETEELRNMIEVLKQQQAANSATPSAAQSSAMEAPAKVAEAKPAPEHDHE
ncbi:MAG: hypothetical protein H6715_05445 [Myxococcales bacterium]|nr:hypothetical protein [Myxococcales bacterium]MCB9709428.1 hypothetical protein [Myxococcales bacterium]